MYIQVIYNLVGLVHIVYIDSNIFELKCFYVKYVVYVSYTSCCIRFVIDTNC